MSQFDPILLNFDMMEMFFAHISFQLDMRSRKYCRHKRFTCDVNADVQSFHRGGKKPQTVTGLCRIYTPEIAASRKLLSLQTTLGRCQMTEW